MSILKRVGENLVEKGVGAGVENAVGNIVGEAAGQVLGELGGKCLIPAVGLSIHMVGAVAGLVHSFKSNAEARAAVEEVARLSANASPEVHPIVLAMVATIAADGRVIDYEVDRTLTTYSKLFGTPITREQYDWVVARAHEAIASGDPVGALRLEHRSIEPQLCPVVFKACCLVAASDHDLAEEELHVLARIALALGLTKEQIENGLEVLSTA